MECLVEEEAGEVEDVLEEAAVEEAVAEVVEWEDAAEEEWAGDLQLVQEAAASVQTAVILHLTRWVLHATSRFVQNAAPE
jgi:hypothetical protein